MMEDGTPSPAEGERKRRAVWPPRPPGRRSRRGPGRAPARVRRWRFASRLNCVYSVASAVRRAPAGNLAGPPGFRERTLWYRAHDAIGRRREVERGGAERGGQDGGRGPGPERASACPERHRGRDPVGCGAGDRRPASDGRAAPHRAPDRRSRAPRGRARARQDAGRAHPRRSDSSPLPAHPVHARPAPGRSRSGP